MDFICIFIVAALLLGGPALSPNVFGDEKATQNKPDSRLQRIASDLAEKSARVAVDLAALNRTIKQAAKKVLEAQVQVLAASELESSALQRLNQATQTTALPTPPPGAVKAARKAGTAWAELHRATEKAQDNAKSAQDALLAFEEKKAGLQLKVSETQTAARNAAVAAAQKTRFSADSAEGTYGWFFLSEVRPNQPSIGKEEVFDKEAIIRAMTEDDVERLLEECLGDVVIDREGRIRMKDHHHTLAAAELAGRKIAYGRLVSNQTGWKQKKSEAWMIENGFVYLIDENGQAITQEELPQTLSEMRNNPLRSLIWFLRKRGVIKKPRGAFAEFVGVEWFRPRLSIGQGATAAQDAVPVATRLVQTVPKGTLSWLRLRDCESPFSSDDLIHSPAEEGEATDLN